jgi:hypothetical protein
VKDNEPAEVVDRIKDLFELDKSEREGFAYPCWACKHRETPIKEAPCLRCEHYAS